MIALVFLKELILIKQVHQKSIIFTTIGFKFQSNVCNKCHDLLRISLNPSDIAILNIKDSDYCCIVSLISKNEAINLLQNAD